VDSDEDRGSIPLASSLRFWSAAQRAKAATPGQSVGGLLWQASKCNASSMFMFSLVRPDETIHYTGTTQDLQARLTKHNQGLCAHTSKHRPWRIQTAIAFGSEVKARAFEKYLKTGSGREFAQRHF